MATNTSWNAQLFSRYHRLHAQYHSYPAPEHAQYPISAFERYSALRSSRALQRPLALNINIPFCANACYNCTHKTTITKDRSRSTAYLQSLEHEIRMLAPHIRTATPITQLHIGGGTPTFLNSLELRQLMRCLQQHFNIVSHNFCNYSIDIDPRETDWATMGVLRDIGFNGIHIMVQAFDAQVQRAINCLHTVEHTQKIVEAARTLQFRQVSISLTYGLPKQTPQAWNTTLSETLLLAPDRIRLQAFMHQPEQYPIQQRIVATDIPSTPDLALMFSDSLEQLANAGYRYIGMGYFALADDEYSTAQEDGALYCGPLGYSTCASSDTLGFGAGAISQLGELYYCTSTDHTAYQSACNTHQLPAAYGVRHNAEHNLRKDILDGLNTQFSLDFKTIEQRYHIDFQAYFSKEWPQLQRMHNDGLLQLSEDSLHMTPQGRLFTLAVCQIFDQYLAQPTLKPGVRTQVI